VTDTRTECEYCDQYGGYLAAGVRLRPVHFWALRAALGSDDGLLGADATNVRWVAEKLFGTRPPKQ